MNKAGCHCGRYFFYYECGQTIQYCTDSFFFSPSHLSLIYRPFGHVSASFPGPLKPAQYLCEDSLLMAKQLPRDVWLYMGQFIPDHALYGMIAINTAFFHLGMNVRYRTISLTIPSHRKREIQSLVRLMDPAIVKRVHVLCITTTGHWSSVRFYGVNRRLGILVYRIFTKSLSALQKTYKTSLPYDSTSEGFIQALIDASSCWSNVKEFSITCWEPSQLLESFLQAGFIFGPRLQKLSLKVTRDCLQVLILSIQCFPSLRTLHITFDPSYGVLSVYDAQDLVILADILNNTSSTLESLSIHSWDRSVDLSQFFSDLGPFPHLHYFSLQAFFGPAFSTTPEGLLHHQSLTLRSITLKLLRRSADTLTDLTVKYQTLTYREVESIVTMLSPYMQLQVLIIKVGPLRLRFFDLLARELPFLDKLYLHISWPERDSEDSEEENMYDIQNGLRTRTYTNWKLRYLGMSGMDRDIIELLVHSIPSLLSLWRRVETTSHDIIDFFYTPRE